MSQLMRRLFLAAVLCAPPFCLAQFEDDGTEHMREELGVNEYTTPSITWLLSQLDKFAPLPPDLVDRGNFDATFGNRTQTAMHFGMLIADGFIVVSNQRSQDVQDVGRSLLRQARALGVGDKITRRSNKLLELGSRNDWGALRTELASTQQDVEDAMMQLRDEEMAHLISFGGWLKGFNAAATATAQRYQPERAELLRNTDIMDYFIDRLDTLHPRLKKTELMTYLTSQMKTIRRIAGENPDRPPLRAEVEQLAEISSDMLKAARGKVDAQGNILSK